MIATTSNRPPWGARYGSAVTLTMPLTEFREIVEWLELLSPDDGCTREWRVALDRLDPEDEPA